MYSPSHLFEVNSPAVSMRGLLQRCCKKLRTRILWITIAIITEELISSPLLRSHHHHRRSHNIRLHCNLSPTTLHSTPLHLTTMFSSVNTFALLIVLSLALASTDAFVTTQRPQRHAVSVNLSPDQASDLVAASNAAYQAPPSKQTTTKSAATARAFAARVFSLPSSLIKRHPHPKVEGLPHAITSTSTSQDVVFFPVIGFQYVKDSPNHCSALPTISVASCSLPNRNEELFGWFSPALQLENAKP